MWALLAGIRVRNAERAVEGEVDVPIGRGRWLTLRAGTTDTRVFRQHFQDRELAGIPHVESVSVIVDLGAHVGIATEVLRRRYPAARIISVEMDPSNADLCRQNHESDPLQETVNAAVWSEEGAIDVEDIGTGNWSHRARGVTVEQLGRPRARVRSVTFETLMREAGVDHISILKMDIEGAEAEVLERSGQAMFTMTDVIVIEIHDKVPGVRERVERVLERASEAFDLGVTRSGEFTCIRPTPLVTVDRGRRQEVGFA